MNLLALDASTTAVGWALFDDGEYSHSGVYEPRDNHLEPMAEEGRVVWDVQSGRWEVIE